MSDIANILKPDGRESGLVKDMRRDEYMGIERLNPSTLAQGLMPGLAIDVRAVRDSFGVQQTFTTAKQDQLDCGTLGHMALIQPERIATDVAVWTGKIRSGGAWEEFQQQHQGELIMRQGDYASVMHSVQQLRARDSVSRFVRDVDAEVAVLVTENGMLSNIHGKGLVDIIDIPRRRIVDVKFTEAGIDEHSIQGTMRRLWYREKMAMYRRWVAMATKTDKESWQCWNLFLSLSGSLGVHVVPYTTAALEWGEARMMRVLGSTAECLLSGEWPMLELESFADVAIFELSDEIEVG